MKYTELYLSVCEQQQYHNSETDSENMFIFYRDMFFSRAMMQIFGGRK